MKNIKKFFLLSLFFILYNLIGFILYGNNIAEFNDLIIYFYGYVNLWDTKSIINIIFWLLPQIIIITMYGNLIEKSLLKNASVIFTRTNNRTKFILKILIFLLNKIALFYLSQMILSIVICILFKIKIIINIETAIMIIQIILYTFFSLITINILSIIFTATIGVYIEISLKLCMIYIISLLINTNSMIIKYIPTGNALLILSSVCSLINNKLAVLNLLYGIVIEIVICILIMKKKEFINTIK